MEILFLKKLLGNLCTIPFSAGFWDGTVENYGSGEPQFKIIFNKPLPKRQMFYDPSLAFGESYMDGLIDYEGNLQEILKAIYQNETSFLNSKLAKEAKRLRKPSLKQQKKDVQYHYDLGNDFFSLWLDETKSYSCGYFASPDDTLLQAQLNKIDHTLKKLNLQAGQLLLDIGSGWGWLIIRAAKKYGVKALGITVSEEQYNHTKERIKKEKVSQLVKVELKDYRELATTDRKFDAVVSVGMVEHVGQANLPVYMKTVNKLLKPQGLSLLHSITHQTEETVNKWASKYIFPGGYIPSIRELVSLMPEHNFRLIDVESLRLHYAKTLEHWAANFEDNVEAIQKKFDERFVRMWRLFLNGCATSFRYGKGLDIHQFLFTKGLNNNIPMTRHTAF